jgi:hypothetical protein
MIHIPAYLEQMGQILLSLFQERCSAVPPVNTGPARKTLYQISLLLCWSRIS